MNMISEMSLNPTYDFDMTAEQLESFSFDMPAAPQARQITAGSAFVPVSQSELEAANAAFARMLAAYEDA